MVEELTNYLQECDIEVVCCGRLICACHKEREA